MNAGNEILDEIYRVREKIAAEAGGDSEQLLAWCAPRKPRRVRAA
jgi:hypothetical protein